MTNTIQREILIPQPPLQVWRGLTESAALAEWLFPNDFEPRVGHRFTFRVPGNPKMNFDGMTIHSEVLECEPPQAIASGANAGEAGGEKSGGRLAFTWSAGPLADTRVSFRLEPDGAGTRILFEHSGFDLSHPHGKQAFRGAEFGWAKMFGQLPAVVAGLAAEPK